MNQAYTPLQQYPQFILHRDKVPCNLSGQPADAHDPANWTDYQSAALLAQAMGGGVGFVLTERDPFFVVDIDGCLTDAGWSPLAMEVLGQLPGCLVEVSQSGKGLHIWGVGACPPHSKKNTALHMELYTESRFIALGNMETATGWAGTDCTAILPAFVARYFAPAHGGDAADWTDGPCEEWRGIVDDDELIETALRSRSAAATFGGAVTFSDLWFADEGQLGRFYPHADQPYDRSSADAALAQHLAFWTGKDCERMERLMRGSALARDKWEREDYLPRTILRACSLQRDVYGQRSGVELDPSIPVAKLKGTEAQVNYAENVRAEKLAQASDEEVRLTLARQSSASLWIDHRDKSPEELARMVTPAPMIDEVRKPTIKSGFQYLGADQQIELFKGCTYIIPMHRVFVAHKGLMLRSEQMNAAYGGYVFQLDETGDKTTRKAWEAFTESQIVSYPQAEGTWFRPDREAGALIDHEGHTYVNIYTPVHTARMAGDVSPFLDHMARILPDERDRRILLSYMAACVQHKGVKFQWTPLIQGAEGNGKTLLTRCVAFAVGERYTHFPPASEISEKFNEWLFGKLFIGIEDIYVPDHKREVIEVLKPMITNDRLAKRAMQQAQVTDDNFANFMLNSNHKDAIRKTENDRRFCVFYTAQQTHEDIKRDGMTGEYFPRLYGWLKEGGYAIVNEYLHTYPIAAEFNPAGGCQRAPVTSTTHEALHEAAGSIEFAVREAIEEGFPGMMGGWVSSVALDRFLRANNLGRFLPQPKRRAFLEGLGFVPHPGLKDGRAGQNIPMDEGKKPRLYIQRGHAAEELRGHAEIVAAYVSGQTG